MAWERRARGTAYYTRSKREGGRVVREYVGGGALGQLAFLEDEERRLERQAARAAARRERDRLLAVRESLDAHRAAVDRVMVDVLEALGFHRRKGEWRRRRTK